MKDAPMDEAAWDETAQRFIDDELSREERVRLLARLGRDAAFRQRLVELEQLAHDTSELPRPVVPAGFTSRVLEAAMPDRSGWRRLTGALWTPRTMQWNVASAVAVAALLVMVFGGALALSGRRALAPGPPSGVVATTPSTSEAVLVRLIVLQPDARTVHVAGDFNGWTPSRTPLAAAPNGAWAVTIPLTPGRYEYQFVVDDQLWIVDPFATEQNDDGFGSRNAVLDVRLPDGAL